METSVLGICCIMGNDVK